MPISRSPTQNKAMFSEVCIIYLFIHYLYYFLSEGSFAYTLYFPILCFCGISEFTSVCVSVHVWGHPT